ncbi:ADP-ribosylglycohydrolase family protein [Heyndrickxia coagulans]|jgi:ADP-ribosyl-[dinitrogen reductase] hydrolase|nr:ADP-ribosylglycohydrolase family protein [Heyndrickxia coagulans]UXC22893.1 ADP-ribosylglycohydrolase family protein [Heyndrickxia coagulans]
MTRIDDLCFEGDHCKSPKFNRGNRQGIFAVVGVGPERYCNTVQTAFNCYQGDWFQASEEAHDELDGKSAGNGTLMRCLPVALAYLDPQKIDGISALQSKMTHYDDLASEACVIYNRIASRLMNGEALEPAIQVEINHTRYASSGVQQPECLPDGYDVHTMEWVFYWLLFSHSFEEVVTGAANMGNDSDTIAAIAGGLKGIEIGFRQIPYRFTDKIVIKGRPPCLCKTPV